GTAGPQLDFLFTEALKAAQDVHRHASRPANADSLGNFAVRRVLAHLSGDTGRVALVGVSPMTRHCGRAFAEHGLPVLVVNRTLEPAEECALEIGAEAMALDVFRAEPGIVDAAITAVGGGEPVLDRNTLAKIAENAPARGVLIVDLGVPPNVDPAAAA